VDNAALREATGLAFSLRLREEMIAILSLLRPGA
jgi:hypothetical protein